MQLRQCFVVLTSLAASGHLAYGAVFFNPLNVFTGPLRVVPLSTFTDKTLFLLSRFALHAIVSLALHL
jgi:hypothetical protein